ncbi:MAG: cytidylate kinase family protein [Clostridia bacterium]|nr:cytidylate kinase family protein [Clostridia bacterium]
MKNLKISLAGDLGSGKSTVGAILAKKYSLEKVSIGQIQRDMATEMGMDTVAFNKYMESHPEYDKILDDKLREYEVKNGNYIFDSRLAWHFVPSSFSVYMTVNVEIAAKRIISANRETEQYASIEDAVKKLTSRRESESLRYKEFYGLDITDLSNYKLVVNTDGQTPEQTAEEISIAFEKWLNT